MIKKLFFAVFFLCVIASNAQDWSSFTDSIATLSSPRCSDLNGDGVMDIVIGGGTDSVFSSNGIMAYNGVDGSLLWSLPSQDEVFGSAVFYDLTADGIDDIIIAGRSAQLLAIDGLSGTLIWDYISANPLDSGMLNFYNPQFIQDLDGDTYPEILVPNGGDHAAPVWQSNRPPGRLMVVSSLTGSLIANSVVPDSAEIYCSPIVADIQNTGDQWVLYGTGGENFGGSFYAVLLQDLLLGDLSGSIVLANDPNKGFIAPAAIYKANSGSYNIIIQSFGGLVTKIDGQNFSAIWTYQKAGTESSAEPVIGNFTGDLIPDVLLVLFKGIAPSYSDFYQVMLDGSDGSVHFLDSMGVINYASANSVDLNNDGRDEGIFSITDADSGYFTTRIESIDFTNNTSNTLDQIRIGVTIGSTPLITDLDNNGLLDLVYSVKKDSLNPMGWQGISVYRHEMASIVPNSGIAWGSYLGTNTDGRYNSELINCAPGTLISSSSIVNPSCNGLSDGSISLVLTGDTTHYTYLWSNQSTDFSTHNLSAGTYWVQVTDSSGCYELRNITLTDPFSISFGGITPPTCFSDSNGTATVNSSGCPCMFNSCTFLWENGITTKNNSILSLGWNSVTITHPGGCAVVDSVLLQDPIIPIDTTFSIVNTCDVFTWVDGVTYTASGLYNNVYTNVFGCDSVATLILTINNCGCIDSLACNYDVLANIDDGSCVLPDGCTDPSALNYDVNATCDDGSCTYCVYGCIYAWACNYDANATCDDGSCEVITGCTDSLACNYDPTIICDDGSCLLPDGCTDPVSCNYNATALCDDGSCILPDGCTDPSALNYDVNATCDDGSCTYCVYGCAYAWACNYDANATCDDGSCEVITGCTDSLACNYDPTIICDDGSCQPPGCTDSSALNYDATALCDDGSCIPFTYGCMDPTATNYNPSVNADDGSCTYSSNCGDVTGLFVSDIIDDRVILNWDNMNTYDANGDQICRLDKLRIKYRPIGTNTWLWAAMGDPSGYDANGFCNSTQVTSKARYQLDMNTTYEWWMRAWYCDGTAANWVEGPQFTTAPECPVVGNLTVVPFTNPNNGISKADFAWDDSNGPYVFCRIKMRIDSISNPVAADWINVGGGSVPYGTFTATKYGLTPGESYRGQAKGHCDPTGHPAYNSLTWTPLIFWTQPSLRVDGAAAITNLDVYPNPSRDVFNISFTSESVQDLKIRVLNVIGEEIVSEDLQQYIGEYTKQIDLTTNAKGIYFLEIETNVGITIKKLILN